MTRTVEDIRTPSSKTKLKSTRKFSNSPPKKVPLEEEAAEVEEASEEEEDSEVDPEADSEVAQAQ